MTTGYYENDSMVENEVDEVYDEDYDDGFEWLDMEENHVGNQ